MAGLQQEFEYYLAHQDELLQEYNGKFLVIKDSAVQGAYETELEAYEAATSRFELGTFLIQECVPGDEAYTQTFCSRVSIG